MIISNHCRNLSELLQLTTALQCASGNTFYFRGESKDYRNSALTPSVYRERYLENEPNIYHEMQRFNDQQFSDDRTTFDRLVRMQHYSAPTRLLDLTEDLLTSLFMAVDGKQDDNEPIVLYIFEIKKNSIRYYDSDRVSVVANLALSPLTNAENAEKSKERLWQEGRRFCGTGNGNSRIEGFNKTKSAKYLLHDIKYEKPYFENLIQPEHIFSVFCVKPKLNNRRIVSQKGAFLLFGLNYDDYLKPIDIKQPMHGFGTSPIEKIYKCTIDSRDLKEQLIRLGITTPFMYPEMDKVAAYLKEIYKEQNVK